MADYIAIESDGKKRVTPFINASRGSQDANKAVETNSAGLIDDSLIDADVVKVSIEASEAIASNRLVEIYNDSGTAKVRLADASNSRQAHGFVKTAAAANAMAEVFRSGRITGLTGIPGADMYLGTMGQPTATPIDFTDAAARSGAILQQLGSMISTDTLSFEHDEPVYG